VRPLEYGNSQMSNRASIGAKVTIICPQYPPEKGAAAARMANLATGLRSRNMDVRVITALPNYPTGRIFPDYRRKIWCSENIEGIPVLRLWLYPSNSANAIKRILNMTSLSAMLLAALPSLYKTRPDVVILNSPPLPFALCGLILSRFVGAYSVMNISDIWPQSALDLGAIQKGRLYSMLEKIEHYIYRKSDAVTAQSNESLQHVLDICPGKRTFLYRNLDRSTEFTDQYPSINRKPLKIVYAGLLGVAQNVYGICQNVAFKALGAEFHLYGDGNERSQIEQYIVRNPNCQVFLHASVPKSEMPMILKDFHATIIPLKSDIKGAFPSKIYMAIAASLPVFFCGAGEGAEFVRGTESGWVTNPGDYRALSAQIGSLATMTEKDYRGMRDRILRLARGTYDLNDQLDKFAEFLRLKDSHDQQLG
jgi:glycosyltransferase involved in cell wall biosynthesis